MVTHSDPVCFPGVNPHPGAPVCVSLAPGRAGFLVPGLVGCRGAGSRGGGEGWEGLRVSGAFAAGGVTAGAQEKFSQEPLAFHLGRPC